MKRTIIIANVLVVSCSTLFAQSADEALRYSELRFGGSARGMGVAGAFGAIGADYASIISNPAGLGVFRKSEAMITLRLEQIKIDSKYDGGFSDDQRFNFNAGNIGVVFSGLNKNKTDWKTVNFGIGYNRLANFHSNRYYRSSSTSNSILQTYRDEITGSTPDNIDYGNQSFESVLAWKAYLLNPVGATEYSSVTDSIMVDQRISQENRGALDELSFAAAGNFKHKLYVGVSLGVPFLFYKERYRHYEQNKSADSDEFNYFDLHQNLNTFGVGVNFKMGLIYRPSDWVRFGAAFHTPTLFGMHDDFSSSVYSDFDTVSYDIESPSGEFEYSLSTPMRFVGSIGLIMKKFAFLSFDYEWVNYGLADYKMSGQYRDFEMGLNNDIKDLYGTAHIFRTGLEIALDKYRLRAGYAHYGSPYKSDVLVGDNDGSVNYFTGGIGVRLKKVYLDFAYVRSKSKAVGITVNDELALDENTTNKYMLTTGFRF